MNCKIHYLYIGLLFFRCCSVFLRMQIQNNRIFAQHMIALKYIAYIYIVARTMYIYTYMILGYTASLFSEAFCDWCRRKVSYEVHYFDVYKKIKEKIGNPFGYAYVFFVRLCRVSTKPYLKPVGSLVMT